jgi:hypothetical protein
MNWSNISTFIMSKIHPCLILQPTTITQIKTTIIMIAMETHPTKMETPPTLGYY